MNLRYPDLVSVFSHNGRNDFSTEQGSADDVRFEMSMLGSTIRLTLTAGSTPMRFLRLRWHFTDDEKRRTPVRVFGDAWERGGGDLEWRGIVPERGMPWFTLVSNGSDSEPDVSGRSTDCFGVKTQPGAFCFWQYDTAGVTMWADVRNGGSGVILNGRTLKVCDIVFETYENCTAFEAGKRFCRRMCDAPLLPKEPVYGANNWYYAYGISSAEDILRDSSIISELCESHSVRPFMVIDDGWSQNSKNGPWDRGNERFPDMAALADGIKQRGAKPGIWVRYIYDEGGVCDLPASWHLERDGDYLDPSRPEVLDYIRKTTQRFVNWGYQLIKYDCSMQDILGRRGYRVPYVVAEDGWHFADQSRTSAEIMTDFYRAVREAAGEDTILIGCSTVTHLCAGLVHLARTGADISGISWDVTRQRGVNTVAFRMMHHRMMFESDADCIGITEQVPWYYNRQWLKLLAVSNTPLFVSCKPGILNEEQLKELGAALRRNLERNGDELIPIDWMENMCPERWLLNGEEIRFDWYDDKVNPSFHGVSI